MENQRLASTSRQCSSTPVGFEQDFLSKEQCDNTVVSPTPPDLAPDDFLPVSSTEISINLLTPEFYI
jgi:hypothetical protein